MRVLVLQSSGDVADLAQRCARWADAAGVEVEVEEPADTRTLAHRLREAGDARIDGIVLERPVDPDGLNEAVHAAGVPVVVVSGDYVADRSGPLDRACVQTIHGRGRGGFRWALRHLLARTSGPWRVWAYGHEPDQAGDLRIPSAVPERGAPLAVLLHGGFWRDEWERDLMDAAAVDLTARGWITWNVEYRRMGPSGGGWPATLEDARVAIAAVTDLPAPVDATRIVLLGHSAGAQLALCAASHPADRAPAGPSLVVGLAPLTDLTAAARDDVGWGSVTAFLGNPDEHQQRYREASPAARLPLGVPQLLVHGLDDRHVPTAMTRTYAAAARDAGDDIEVAELPGTDHFQIIDPAHPSWATLVAMLA